MVTKEEVERAKARAEQLDSDCARAGWDGVVAEAAAATAAEAAWDNYWKLKREYENGN